MRSFAIFAPLLALTAVQCVALAVYVAAGVPPSPAMSRISSMSLALFLVYWIIADARCRRCVPCHDFGFLVIVFGRYL
jgi:hypothetical protein